jgi:hypothetical protein
MSEMKPPTGGMWCVATKPTREHRKLSKIIRDVRAICREHGYALTEHGSRLRDVDLVAVPWTPKAIPSGTLLKHLGEVDGLTYQSNPTGKPHGRIAATYLFRAKGGGLKYIDLSVCPRQGDW